MTTTLALTTRRQALLDEIAKGEDIIKRYRAEIDKIAVQLVRLGGAVKVLDELLAAPELADSTAAPPPPEV